MCECGSTRDFLEQVFQRKYIENERIEPLAARGDFHRADPPMMNLELIVAPRPKYGTA
jgi:hypothetical protein